ncbi:MAG: peroxidase-related enzyme [Anaerolineae bacterium]|nr:peroxidase-related enzyme [Anaerolineae bacterium]
MAHHGEALRRLKKDDALLAALVEDYTRADLEPADRAMLDYVAKLTRTPSAVTEDDVETLRQAGFDDRAILDIALVTAYFAFVTRIADGLGVQLEEW